MRRPWIETKNDARKLELELLLRRQCQIGRGMMWLSTRLLCRRLMYRDATEVMKIRAQLAAEGRICFVTALGRGQGRGRTLYWLPSCRPKVVLRVLREEKMPSRAIEQAMRFFVRPKNEMDADRQEGLSTSYPALSLKKDARATRAEGLPPQNGPPRPRSEARKATSPPPSLRRLARHGLKPLPQVIATLSITDNLATHPRDCECGQHQAKPDSS
jgi:hypothetical protein